MHKQLPPTGRILAMDLGKKRIGMAISDGLRITAQGIDTYYRVRIREDLDAIARIAEEREVVWIVLGDPIHMSGRESRQQVYTHEFADRLAERTGIGIDFWDERLTSVEAGRVLRSSGISIEKRAKAVDKLSAVLLLESYLDRLMIERDEAADAAAEAAG